MAHRVAPLAEADLDAIWYYVAKESSSIETANRLVNSITDRFLLLSQHPFLGRTREEDLGTSTRSFAVSEYVIIYRVEVSTVLILRVMHGRRDLENLFGH